MEKKYNKTGGKVEAVGRHWLGIRAFFFFFCVCLGSFIFSPFFLTLEIVYFWLCVSVCVCVCVHSSLWGGAAAAVSLLTDWKKKRGRRERDDCLRWQWLISGLPSFKRGGWMNISTISTCIRPISAPVPVPETPDHLFFFIFLLLKSG